jgi:hypothetical protein
VKENKLYPLFLRHLVDIANKSDAAQFNAERDVDFVKRFF